MSNKKLFFYILLVLSFFLSISTALANSIDVMQAQDIQIQEWRETNTVIGKDLSVNITYILKINRNLDKTNTIEFHPEEFVGSKDNKNVINFNVSVCENPCSGVQWSNLTDSTNQSRFYINISQKNLEWKENENSKKPVALKINYLIPNYIASHKYFIPINPDNTLFIRTSCRPKYRCPDYINVTRQIILPNDIEIQSYFETESYISFTQGGVLSIVSGNPNITQYKNIIIYYKDVNAERNIFWSGVFFGAIVGGIAGLIIQHCYYKKSKEETETEFKNLRNLIKKTFNQDNRKSKYKK